MLASAGLLVHSLGAGTEAKHTWPLSLGSLRVGVRGKGRFTTRCNSWHNKQKLCDVLLPLRALEVTESGFRIHRVQKHGEQRHMSGNGKLPAVLEP